MIVTLYLLLSTDHTGLGTIGNSLHALNDLSPSAWLGKAPRVTKLTALYNHDNDLYEAAIKSHMEHNRIHGYGMKILRDKIVNDQWSKPAYLLSLVVEELAKPAEARTEWLMYDFGHLEQNSGDPSTDI